jgi:hypothetical protein
VNKARKALVEYGLNPKAVEAMLPLQVVILDESRKFEEDRDLISSWLMQPYPQAERALPALEEKKAGLFSEKMLPTTLRVYRAADSHRTAVTDAPSVQRACDCTLPRTRADYHGR